MLTWALLFGAAGAALAPAGPGALVPLKMAIASADSVGNDVYVAVVVEFGSGSSLSTVSKCVPVPSTDRDSDALAAAVGEANVSYSSSGLLCAIDNYPANGVQNCGQSVGSGDYDYWSYWHGSSGSWVYANNGPAEQPVSSPDDDVEGWRFQDDEPDNSSDPPPTVAASYAQICNASTEVPPAQLPSSAVTTTTTTSPPQSVTSTTARGASTGPGLTVVPSTPTTQARSGAAPNPVPPSTSTTSTTGPGTSGTTGGGKHSISGTHAAAVASSAPRRDTSGGSNTFLPVVLVGAVVAVLGGMAFFRWRRRPVDE
ncbi:MAG TPA: hypothetical protein VEH82_03885 [Acidimicrobiales bacterium]|nr:hypothetical protein [Acidimicrobiales bacterium]